MKLEGGDAQGGCAGDGNGSAPVTPGEGMGEEDGAMKPSSLGGVILDI